MKLRRIAAVAAASAMALSVAAVPASAYEYTAFLMFTDIDWLWGNWDAGKATDATITGPGTYTVSLDNTQAENAMSATNGANVFCVDIIGGYADLADLDVTLDSVKADGVDVPFDPEKICYGDIEEKGNYRIEIQNAYGLTGDMSDPHYGAIDAASFSAAEKIEVTFTISDPNGAAAEEAAPAEESAPAEETAAVETTEAPAADTTTTSTATGNTSAAALAGVMVTAAAAALIAKKRSK
ncbi:MAG: hypothetical protein PUI48_04130 [Oscillospiraceae bacterium]|nr:hypothetical protein [Oscillospiraceae bacterium]MDY3792695.1 hypothetical protein [Oscillospiraceae bacterium]MDY6208738.1 hypothetical protein [Oscillospiraceae bacterium]